MWPRLLVLVVVGYMGVKVLTPTVAATYSASEEAEIGTYGGNFAILSDPSYSGGGAVRFGDYPAAGESGSPALTPLSLGVAPYAYIPWGDIEMSAHSTATGVKQYYGAFIQAGGASNCNPYWDGDVSLTMNSNRATANLNDINAVRSKGGDVAISFGGASGTELSNACSSVASAQAAYQTVITKYKMKHINFDLEGPSLTNTTALSRRVQTAFNLQQANPGLKISLTLPVEPDGLQYSTKVAINKFVSYGVKISQIGIMAMDFGDNFSEPQRNRVIAAADNTIVQLRELLPGASDGELRQALNVIVMIGKNDTNEIFTPADAAAIRDYARANGVGTLSYWSAARDQQCGNVANATPEIGTCSEITQSKWLFASIFKGAYQ